MDVKLSSKEGDVLIEILEERDRVLREKIAHTKKATAKKTLREEETRLESIIEQLDSELTGGQDFSDLWW